MLGEALVVFNWESTWHLGILVNSDQNLVKICSKEKPCVKLGMGRNFIGSIWGRVDWQAVGVEELQVHPETTRTTGLNSTGSISPSSSHCSSSSNQFQFLSFQASQQYLNFTFYWFYHLWDCPIYKKMLGEDSDWSALVPTLGLLNWDQVRLRQVSGKAYVAMGT